MMIRDRDTAALKSAAGLSTRDVYYAAVPADLLDDDSTVIEELIGFAFDTLGGFRLDVRVYDGERSREVAAG
jgi:hypothetical protein